ncbi:polysaccharide pyruvyl transferase WcaK-like protein [Rhodobacter viridis]|uniref:Polysaccharide pyruvyl transferase WcaK-like protein n=1 Tax=Rhodobacter viridis TaxID=1054202 RepID=A0A318TRJ0_9RHOB|nr:polysaccharide pyruvyl transferase family protein [Rhodobacter viridis]PYF07466.1 polysaccharide pyruvyl transferase WcaK-like protein [Rhodobacter viridis]
MTNSPPAGLRFDAKWYAETYPDVARAVRSGGVRSLVSHYLDHGSREGRLPFPPEPQNDRVFVYGSFGSNNVGDEAILEGVRTLFPACHQFYLNKKRNGNGSFPHRALENPDFFRPNDLLILGGGGLLYDRPTVQLMLDLARAARARGAEVDIQRLGCEAASPDYHDVIRDLFALARFATVRSTISQRIIHDITGRLCPVEMDFAFNLQRQVPSIPRLVQEDLTIGIVTASMGEADRASVTAFLRHETRHRTPDGLRFVHIPHSRSYFNAMNNDCILGEQLWCGAHMQSAWAEDAFALWPFQQDPSGALAQYRKLDGVISFRYHSMIFARLCNLPTLAVGAELPKIASFVDDNPSPLLHATAADNLQTAFAPFLQLVRAERSKIKPR